METEYIGSEGLMEFALHGKGNAIVDAVAGSGKSTALRNIIKALPRTLRILLVSFNKTVAEENRTFIGDDRINVDVKTTHAMGLRVLQENFRSSYQDDDKYNTLIRCNLEEITDTTAGELGSWHRFLKYKDNLNKLFQLSRSNCASTYREVEDIAEKYEIMPLADEIDAVLKLMEWGMKHTETYDYTDMIWLPVALKLTTNLYKYDFIFIDEAQDTTIMGQRLMDIFKYDTTRFIAVGDAHQCINAWCGADNDAFQSFMKYPNTIRINMHESWRCFQLLEDLVHKYVPHFKVKPNAIKGEVHRFVDPDVPKSGDMLLVRFVATGVDYYNHCLDINKKAYIYVDADYVKNLSEIIDETGQTELNRDLGKDGVFVRLYERLFREIDLYCKRFDTTMEEAIANESIHTLYENIVTLEHIAQSLTTAEELKRKIRDIFAIGNGEGVRISTIHRAKGSEADNVYILGESLMPSPLAHKEWQIQEENNLIYVAYTRPKKSLNFIDEKKFPVDTFFSRKDLLLAELERVRGLVEFTLQEEYNKEKAKQLREEPQIEPVKKQITTRKVGGKKFSMFK